MYVKYEVLCSGINPILWTHSMLHTSGTLASLDPFLITATLYEGIFAVCLDD